MPPLYRVRCKSRGKATSEPGALNRELGEELGIAAAAWTPLGRVNPDTAKLRSPVWPFLAERLFRTPARQSRAALVSALRAMLQSRDERSEG